MAELRFSIEAGHIMMFARTIGDPDPAYHDADHAAPRPATGSRTLIRQPGKSP